MNFIFFGTPDFAATILAKLIDAGFSPQLLICNPDRPAGRKQVITPPPIKLLAQKHGVEVWQPEKLEIENCKLKIGGADFAVLAAYAKIIPKEIIDLFPLGIVGIHPSLLPKYRGTSPIQAVILNGDVETGVTLYLLDEKVDHGPILINRKSQMANNETYEMLLKKLAELGGDMLVEILPKFAHGEIKPAQQNEAEATYTKKIVTEDGFIAEKDLSNALSGRDVEKVGAIDRKIRALNPEPGAWTYANSLSEWGRANIIENGKRVKLLEAEIENGRLRLKKIQEEGKIPRSL